MKTATNCHRLKLWLDPDGGRLKPQKVCMYVCMYTCTHAFVQISVLTCMYCAYFWMQDATDDTKPSVNNSRKPRKKTGGSGNPLPPKKKSKGRFGYMYTCSISNVC